jgi:small subunit ribosomal protein S20
LFDVPHAKSCKKRLITNAKRNERNSQNRAELRTAVKVFRSTIGEASAEDKAQSVKTMYSLIDTHARKGLMPRQRAARLKSRVAAAAK